MLLLLLMCLVNVDSTQQANNCPGGWTYYSETDSCFKKITDKLGWVDAKTRCESFGSNLASVTTAQENKYIRGLFGGNEGIWIGLNDRKRENHFEWVDGTPFTPNVFAGWSNPSPYDEHEDCVALWRDITWNDASCNLFKFASVCKKPANCPRGWSYYSETDSCFKTIKDKLEWVDAKTRCESLAFGSNLASVTTAQENKHIRGLIGGNEGIWIGLNDRKENKHFEWVDGTPFEYAGWSNPSNDDGEDCVALWRDITWNDASCTKYKFASVCKKPTKAASISKCLVATELMIKLEGGSTPNQGHVLLWNEAMAEYRHVCDDRWDNRDATVACRMLGYSSGTATTWSTYGPARFISYDEFYCKGTEKSLYDCYHHRENDCRSHEGAGVICS